MRLLLLLILSILPIILLILYINNKDNEKEPKLFLLLMFFCGFLSCLLVLTITSFINQFINIVDSDISNLNFIQLFLYVFFVIALVEEFCKWLFVRLIGFNSDNFDETFDIIVYSSFVSLGFACIENILYVVQDGFLSALLRSVTSVPGHLSFGIISGYYLLLARIARKNNNNKLYLKNMLLSLIIPFLAHGIYDYLLFLESNISLFILGILIVIFFIYCHRKLIQISSINRKIFYKNDYCPICGKKTEDNYCTNCGNKNI